MGGVAMRSRRCAGCMGPRLRRGTAIVEMAIVLPILMLLLFGIIEFGHVMFVRYNMINAATQAARVGVVTPNATEELLVARAQDALDNSGMGQYAMSISAEITSPPDIVITVSVSIPYSEVAIFSGFMSESLVLSSTCTNYK